MAGGAGIVMGQVLRVGENRLLLLRYGGKRCFDDVEAFVELLVGDDQRDKDANDVVESAGGDGNEAVLIAIFGDGFGFGVGGFAGLRVADQFDGAHAAETADVADERPFLLPGLGALFKMFADGSGAREEAVFLDGFDGG